MLGPQKGPSTVRQIEAQVKHLNKELEEAEKSNEPEELRIKEKDLVYNNNACIYFPLR